MNDLNDRFRELREEEQRAAPSFATILSRPPAPHVHLARIAAAISFVGLLTLAVLLSRDPHTAPSSFVMPPWQAPTDFLLRTPGIELVESTPRIGDVEPPLKGTS